MKTIVLLISAFLLLSAQDQELHTCGMHPQIIQKGPGQCPICGMDLTPLKMENMSVVVINPELQQSIGVRSEKVKRRMIPNQIQTVGYVVENETKQVIQSTKISGWIEELYANESGKFVSKGQVLYSIYSPDVLSAQEDLLSALTTAKVLGTQGAKLIESAKNRLRYWDISEDEISEIIDSQKTKKAVRIYAKSSGYIRTKNISKGQFVKAGDDMMTIVDLNSLWVMTDIFEKNLSAVKVGNHAHISTDQESYIEGKIDYIYPEIDKKTRTIKARITVKNNKLKINQFVRVSLTDKTNQSVLSVPQEAVIKTGNRTLVIIKGTENTFHSKEIKTGRLFIDYYEVLSGLEGDEDVVSSAHFLIDSESKIQKAIQSFGKKVTKSETSNTELVEINLPSIQCENCVETITKAFDSVADVQSVHVDLEKKVAHVKYDNSKMTVAEIEQIISKSGYHANMTKRLDSAYELLDDCCKEGGM